MSATRKQTETELPGYEAAVDELESIVRRLDDNEVGVDELAPLVERATVLIQHCKQLLASTGSRVAKAIEGLQAAADGQKSAD